MPPPSKPSTNLPIDPSKSTTPATETDLAAARLLLDLSNHITAAETLLTLYIFGPPTNTDSAAVFDTTKSSKDTKMVNLYCHGTNLHLQKPQDQAQAYLRSLSPAGRKGLVLLPAGVRRDGRLFAEELHGKIGCRRCAAVRAAAALGHEGAGSETEVEKVAELAAPESRIKQPSTRKKITSVTRVAKAPRKRVRIAEPKTEGVEVAAALGVGATVVGGWKVARRRRSVKAPVRFGA